MTEYIQSDDTARALDAQLLDSMTLGADGQPFDDGDPDSWAAADASELEVVRLGPVRFRIVDADAVDLAIAAGAIEPGGPPASCLRVAFEVAEGAPQPCIGQYVVLPSGEPGVSLTFVIWTTHSDLHDPAAPDLGPDAIRNETLDELRPGEALLVQVFSVEPTEAE